MFDDFTRNQNHTVYSYPHSDLSQPFYHSNDVLLYALCKLLRRKSFKAGIVIHFGYNRGVEK